MKIRLLIFLIAALGLFSCQQYTFVKTGTANHLASRSSDCPITVYQSLPQDINYQELGLCIASASDFLLLDRTDEAIEDIKACACEKGGNAVFIESIDREMDNDGNWWTRVTATLLIVEK